MVSAAQTDSGFTARVALLYAAIFMLVGIQLPFFPLWLEAKGLDSGTIGLVLAMPMVVRLLAVPAITRQADRRDALRGLIVICSVVALAGYVLVGLADGALAILVTVAAMSAAWTPVMPLAETYALKGLAARRRAYGPVRLWGSAAFVAGTLAAGFIADRIPTRDLVWLMVGACALNALVVLMLPPLHVEPHAVDAAAPRRGLLRDPLLVVVLMGASLIQGSHAVYYAFSTLAWTGAGLGGKTIAALWSLGVIAEIVLFAISGRLPPFFSPSVLLIVGAAGAVARWAAMALDPPVAALPFLQLLHALSFGATHLGTLGFIVSRAPPGQAASAQGTLVIVMGLMMAAMTSLSGLLFAAYGSLSYAAMALAALAGGACGLVAHRLGRDAARL